MQLGLEPQFLVLEFDDFIIFAAPEISLSPTLFSPKGFFRNKYENETFLE